ncbi:PAS domain S-box protein [Caldithrix abyssi]
MSSSFEKITGYSPAEFSTQRDFMHKLIAPEYLALWQEHLRNRQKPSRIKLAIRCKNGDTKQIEHRCYPFYDENKNYHGSISSNKALTQGETDKQAEIEKAAELLTDAQTFRHGPVVVFKWKNAPGWPVEYVSHNVREVFGYTVNEIVSGKMDYAHLIFEEDLPRVKKEVEEYSKSGAEAFQHQPYRIKRKDGKIVWLLDFTTVHRQQNKITDYTGYVVDITEMEESKDSLQNYINELQLLQAWIARLNRARSLKEVYETAVDGILEILKCDRSSLLLFEADGKVHFKAWRNLSDSYRKAVDGHSPWKPEDLDAEPIFYSDISRSDLDQTVKRRIVDEGIGALLFVPLVGPEKLLGKFMVYFNTPTQLTEKQLWLTQILSQNLAAIISSFQLLKKEQEAQKKYREIFENVSEGIYQSTKEGKLITVNQAMVKMFGYRSKEEMLNIPNSKILYWDAAERERLARLVEADGTLKNVEVRMKRKDGTEIWVLLNDRVITDQEGKILYYEGTVLDITDRKKAEQKHREQARLFRAISDNMTDLLWAKDLNKRYIFANKAICEKLLNAKDTEEPIGKNDIYFAQRERQSHPENPEYHTFGEICADSDQIVMDAKKPMRFDEFGNVKGKFLFLDVRKSPLFDEHGKMIGVVGSARDVTAEKEMQKRLKESEERYRMLFNLLPYGGEVLNTNGIIVEVSPSTCKMLGYDRDELIGQPISKFLAEPSLSTFQQKFPELLKGKAATAQVQFVKKDGQLLDVLRAANAITNENGKVIGILGINVDISERVKIEKELITKERKEKILNDLLKLILLDKPLEQKLARALEIILDAPLLEIQQKGGIFFVADEHKKQLKLMAAKNLSEQLTKSCALVPFGKCLCGQAASSKKLMFRSHVDEGHSIRYAGMSDHGHYIVPILAGEKVLGVLVLYLPTHVKERPEEREFLQIVSQTLASIIEHHLAKRELQRQITFVQALNSLSQFILVEQDRQKIFDFIVELIGKTLKLDATIIYQVDVKNKFARYLGVWKRKGVVTPEPLNYDLSSWTNFYNHLGKQKKYLVSHADVVHPAVSADGLADFFHGQRKLKSFLIYPFGFSKDGFYALSCTYFVQTHEWEESEISFIEALTHRCNIALMKLKLMEEQEKAHLQIERLASLVEQAAESIVITDTQGHVEYVNPAFEKITGYTINDVMQEKTNLLKNGQQEDENYRELLDTISAGKTWRGQFVNKRKNGERYFEDAVIFPLIDKDGKITNYCKIARDVTREKELENQLHQAQKMESIGTLAGGVAHDFNNLLTVINGYAELMRLSMNEDHPLHKAVSAISEAGKRAAELTNQLLAFSRKQVSKSEVININEIIASMEKMLKRLIGEDIYLEKKLDSHIHRIKADKSHLEQIIMNLVVNARDAIRLNKQPEAKKEILIKTGNVILDDEFVGAHPGSKKGSYVCLSIADTGLGMDEKTKTRIFEPFFTTKEKGQGTGLGLALVYGIVKQHNGYISVHSMPGEGTTFKIYFPTTSEKPAVEKRIAKKKEYVGTETILLVEDDAQVREFTSNALKSLHYKVIEAENGRKAIDLIEKRNIVFDLIISDVVMPDMNGLEMVKIVKRRQPDVKVILISGYTDNIVEDGQLSKKEFHYLQKPFSVEQLARKIREVLAEA